MSASPPHARDDLETAIDPAIRPVLGARSGERSVALSLNKQRSGCLSRDEVVAYLGRGCPRELRARVDAHVNECGACQRWVRHVGDEILDYIGGQLSEGELGRMDAHLDACSACRDLVHHMVQGMGRSWHGEGHDAADPGTTFLPGNIVNGRYMILRFVGRGGMGEVYEAFDQLMDRRIALKTVLCTVADRPRAARRFKEEVRNAQRVGHRNVCRINDLQEHRETTFGPPLPFFTMEFIEGERLGNRLAADALPLEDVRIIAQQLLAGLEAAHARGVLHLDFKSDNVMLRRDTETPEAVIMDFGLSRVLGKESRLRTSDRRQFAGTLPYMSVEQLECREALGPTTDVYAFGVVLYEMLTRSLPFDGESLGAILLKQLKERPKPPSVHVPELSPELDQFVLRCLHSNPHLRFADAGQALVALQAVQEWTRPPAVARLRQSLPWLAAAVGLGIVAVSSLPRDPAGSSPAARLAPAVTERPAPRPPERAVDESPSAPMATTPPSALPPSATPPARLPSTGTLPAVSASPETTPAHAAERTRRPSRSAALTQAAASSLPAAGVAAPAVNAGSSSIDDGTASHTRGSPPAQSPADEATARPAAESGSRSEPAAHDGAWKPARVPKRLSLPAAATAGASHAPREGAP